MTLGTDVHPFDRAVRWLDSWLETQPELQQKTIVQHGFSQPSVFGQNRSFIEYETLIELMAEAQVVITHAGPATVFEARRVGRAPICVARNPELGEHVDGHQLRFSNYLGAHRLVILCPDELSFRQQMDLCLADASYGAAEADPGHLQGTMANLQRVLDSVTEPRWPMALRTTRRRPLRSLAAITQGARTIRWSD